MPSVSHLLEEIKRVYPILEAYSLLNKIVTQHRVQGSKGLWSAVNLVKEFLSEQGVGSKVISIESGEQLDLDRSPVGWDLTYGELVVEEDGRKIVEINTLNHPTLVAAHSPSGEGRAKLSLASLEGISEASGAVLTSDSPYMSYALSGESVEALIWYDLQKHRDGVPYAGLFLSSMDRVERKPVLTMPGKTALKIIEGLRRGQSYIAEWRVEAKYTSSGLPILESCIGSGEYAVASTAHICHPRPGAHDNASGSAVLAGAAVALDKLVKKYEPLTRICFYWVPEYTGTTALFLKGLMKREVVVASLNVDMVASRQSETGSTLHLIRSMLNYSGPLTPVVKLSLESTYLTGRAFHGRECLGKVRFDEVPYGSGSDHDVFLINGVESPMLNEWPSKYYHTDLDEPDAIGLKEFKLCGKTVALSLLLTSTPNVVSGLSSYVRSYYSYLTSWYSMDSARKGINEGFTLSRVAPLLSNSLTRAVEWIEKRKVSLSNLKSCCMENPVYIGRSIVNLRPMCLEKGVEFYRLIDALKIWPLVTAYLPANLNGSLSTKDLVLQYYAEEVLDPAKIDAKCYGVTGISCLERIVEEVVEWISEKGFIKK
ncbi:MAG: M28 family peptidase [Desulfurococcaceae archaeon]